MLNVEAPNLAPVNGKRGRQRDEPLTGFVRLKLTELLREKGDETMNTLAKQAGLPPSGPSQVLGGTLGVAGGTAPRYAKMLGFESKKALVIAAEDWWDAEGKHAAAARSVQPEPIVEKPDRYFVMPLVRAAAKSDGIPDEFVERFVVGLDLDEQPSFSDLYDLLKANWKAKRGKGGGTPVGPTEF